LLPWRHIPSLKSGQRKIRPEGTGKESGAMGREIVIAAGMLQLEL